MAKDKRREEGRLAGPTADHGSPEEFARVGDLGEDPEWKANTLRPGRGIGPKFKLMNENGGKVYAVILDRGAEIMTALRRFTSEQGVPASRFAATGAFSGVVLGAFNPSRKDYRRIVIPEQVEVLSLTGEILPHGPHGMEPRIDVRVVVGKSDGTAHGGRLLEGHVYPALELIVTESPNYIRRRYDEESGLPLPDFDAA